MSGLKSKVDDPREQVLALICGNDEPWAWGGDAHQCRISFDRDGTGALDCGENQRSWIAAEFNWAFSAEPVRADNGNWTIPIQMTLSTRIAPYLQKDNHWLQGAALQNHVENPPPASDGPFSWAPLRAAAFRPKQYTLTLSYGNFIEPFYYFIKPPYPLLQSGYERFAPNRFSRKLAFDKSPYPPLEEWADTHEFGNLKGSLRYHHYWERTDFVRGPFGWKRRMWENFLDLGWWLSPSAGDGYLR